MLTDLGGCLMGIMVSEVYEALIEAGASESKAKAAAESIPLSEQLATKQDLAGLKGDMASLKGDMANLRGDMANLRGDMANLKADMANLKAEFFRALWVQGAGIVALIVGLTKLL